MGERTTKKQIRERRLSDALRENLKKRKSQARDRDGLPQLREEVNDPDGPAIAEASTKP